MKSKYSKKLKCSKSTFDHFVLYSFSDNISAAHECLFSTFGSVYGGETLSSKAELIKDSQQSKVSMKESKAFLQMIFLHMLHDYDSKRMWWIVTADLRKSQSNKTFWGQRRKIFKHLKNFLSDFNQLQIFTATLTWRLSAVFLFSKLFEKLK